MKTDTALMGVTIFKKGKRRGSYQHIKGSEIDTLLAAIVKYTHRKGFLFCVNFAHLYNREDPSPYEIEKIKELI